MATKNVRSIEEQVEDWCKTQLRSIKYYTKNESINSEIEEALRKLDNVILSPHIGSATESTRLAMANLVLANVDAYLKGESLVTQVKENKF